MSHVDSTAKTIKQLGFCNQEVNPLERALLSRKGNIEKPVEPLVYTVRHARSLKLRVIIFAMPLDHLRKSGNRRRVEALS